MTLEQFKESLLDFNIKLTDNQINQLEQYYNLLVEWNQKMNLTGITEQNQVYLKHFYDSITIVKIIDLNNINSLCDIGTGAGFPGIVLKIVFPNLNITLVDSLGKRITFLNEVIRQLKLDKIKTVLARAEEYALENRELYDVVTARAVANLNMLLEYSICLVKVNGYFIPMKASCEEEISGSKNALNLLKSEIETICRFQLPYENSNRTIIKIKKNDITPTKYPRKYSEIKKHPLN